nr:hypothetical protein [Bacteroidota bacterium]
MIFAKRLVLILNVYIFTSAMKKLKAIILLVLFLTTNSGMAISVHWCCGKLASVHFTANKTSKCQCGKKVMKANCCKDKTIVFKAKGDFAKTQIIVVKLHRQQLFLLQLHHFKLQRQNKRYQL